jgi:hypothetical protein
VRILADARSKSVIPMTRTAAEFCDFGVPKNRRVTTLAAQHWGNASIHRAGKKERLGVHSPATALRAAQSASSLAVSSETDVASLLPRRSVRTTSISQRPASRGSALTAPQGRGLDHAVSPSRGFGARSLLARGESERLPRRGEHHGPGITVSRLQAPFCCSALLHTCFVRRFQPAVRMRAQQPFEATWMAASDRLRCCERMRSSDPHSTASNIMYDGKNSIPPGFLLMRVFARFERVDWASAWVYPSCDPTSD